MFAGTRTSFPQGQSRTGNTRPFRGRVENGVLYGRGCRRYEGSLAAFLTARERFVERHPHHKGSIAWLITSDEEGPSVNGTVKVVEHLVKRNEKIDWCLVGEPSSTTTVGDIIKNGRRGSLGAHMKVFGIQGHVAYPIWPTTRFTEWHPLSPSWPPEHWDEGNAFFPGHLVPDIQHQRRNRRPPT